MQYRRGGEETSRRNSISPRQVCNVEQWRLRIGQVDQQQHAANLVVNYHLLNSHLGGGGTIPGFNTGDLVCAQWVGWDRHPVCQLSAGHPSFRGELWRSNNFAQQGADGAKWRNELPS